MPSLFKNNKYTDVIRNYITKEMTNKMKDSQSSYFLKNNEEPARFDKVSKIKIFI
ncbi:hypothetical protein NCCP28_46920 [Niallia sp. NCCP-28]|nr:hypothetical protein NCCP28_46920 [Niallia sp. NCCP-28]